MVSSTWSGSPVGTVPEVNGHLHTPYSFSAFSGVDHLFSLARQEGISVVGINDFNVTEGYSEFYQHALKNRIFPLFNIEFIGLDRELQKQGMRINDPSNPGRIYLSGKGLDYPAWMDEESSRLVQSVIHEGHRQIRMMIDKINRWLALQESGISLDFEEISSRYAKGLVRERHIAKALRLELSLRYPDTVKRLELLTRLYDGRCPKADPASEAAMEIEIRNNLLKSGGRAFVKEDEQAFLNIHQITGLITASGGVPCYPVLLDDAAGHITDFESNPDQLRKELLNRDIHGIELIPGRNDHQVLKSFVQFFHDAGFWVLLGTEHNTPELAPLTVRCRHGVDLDPETKRINFEGACILAAHQQYRTQGIPSPVATWTRLSHWDQQDVIRAGQAAIDRFINQ